MKAVHFGAGNIGRGFVGVLLHQAGYEVVFSDVAAALVDALNAADSYTVREAGEGGRDTTVTGFRAINSAAEPQAVAQEVAEAHLVTTAVGPGVLKFIAQHIVDGLQLRSAQLPPLQVMACENAVRATDTLRGEVERLAGSQWPQLRAKATFANTAVDRIVPGQSGDTGVDVTVEPFYEWVIESAPFGGDRPQIPGVHFVPDLEPYIERKLFTVNTGHASAAYLGSAAGHTTIAASLADPQVSGGVEAALRETSALLVAKHGFSAADMAEYRAAILQRFRNPALPDTTTRVGRQPLRKLSRKERFIAPAAEAAELGMGVDGLLAAISAALTFHAPEDDEAAQLQRALAEVHQGSVTADEFTAEITGLGPEHPLFPRIREEVRRCAG
ncbi:mannitol-1-phosphate 5-dehydrogenase [Nesterenkonia sphaerica]|uniref:Mannitol-1-phosphate 5-dehydrogenase n=1 Tax=Nesterenkonia sphaerica TaxID=1804988 RepID=A0A5R9AH41_9MICC|nr:mannitol-1-phosphate 5-dehydrogenase [Nesterenkonia sphaerica]TLP77156.1 mannitol-1-phosphate 5-dehydrogenase [Nesterenkonia sphaerica]